MHDLPQRPVQHIIDEQGILLLQEVFDPAHYIFHNLSSRDYGIDCFLEVVEKGNVTGRMLSLQLKSSTQFPNKNYIKQTIQFSTCNYWFQNVMPVLLVMADITNRCLYYVDVKEQIRERYSDFSTKRNFTFEVPADSKLISMDNVDFDNRTPDMIQNIKNHMRFKLIEFLMFDYSNFENALNDFITNRFAFYEHINHQHADEFLTQPQSFYNITQHIQYILIVIARHLYLSIDSIDFDEVRKKCEKVYQFYHITPDNNEVIEYEITVLHQIIMKNILQVIDTIHYHIRVCEKDYWETINPRIFNEAYSLSQEEFKEHCYWARL